MAIDNKQLSGASRVRNSRQGGSYCCPSKLDFELDLRIGWRGVNRFGPEACNLKKPRADRWVEVKDAAPHSMGVKMYIALRAPGIPEVFC